jgi:hypothetical protein
MGVDSMSKKKHTPGRGHRRKSDPQKQEKWQKKAARQREAARRALQEAWERWDRLSDEKKKLLRELKPKKPRPTDDQ